MAYKRAGGGGKIHPADAYAAAQIAAATGYSVHFRKGPFEKYTELAASLEEARAIRDRLDAAHGQWGRRSVVYAIAPSGALFPIVDESLSKVRR